MVCCGVMYSDEMRWDGDSVAVVEIPCLLIVRLVFSILLVVGFGKSDAKLSKLTQ